MSCYVFLTDQDNATVLVKCKDEAEATRVAEAGVWSDGDVSAWYLPSEALVASDQLVDLLNSNHTLYSVSRNLTDENAKTIRVNMWKENPIMQAKNIRRAFVTVKVAAAVWYRPYVIGYFVGKKIHQYKTKKP